MNFKIRFRRFIAKYLGVLVELVYKLKFKSLHFDKPPIIILTPGKVGSSSIYATLKKKVSNPVFHIHNLSEQGIQNSIKTHINSDRKSKPLHLIVSKLLREKRASYKGKSYVITIIREPISREISSFFQNTEFYKEVLENKKLEVDVEKAHQILDQKFESDICKQLEDWFDLEIKGNFDIDVFSQPFNYDKKYLIIKNKNTNLLLLKMEDLNKVFPIAIQEFLNLKAPMQLQNVNVGDDKHYANSYKTVKEKLRLDSKSINQIVSAQYFQQFYLNNQDEILEKWTKNN